MEKPYKVVLGWILFFCCIVTPMFLFPEIIKANEILSFVFVSTTICIMFISPLIGIWFLKATEAKS